jgi:hypothetical protein
MSGRSDGCRATPVGPTGNALRGAEIAGHEILCRDLNDTEELPVTDCDA